MTTRICKKCNESKTLENFYKHARYKGGYKPTCKPCTREEYHSRPDVIEKKKLREERRKTAPQRQRERYQANKEKRREYQRAYHKKNPEASRRTSLKYWKKLQKATPTLRKPERRAIEDLYAVAKYLTATTGIPHEVDHIQPLNAGGSHHPDNLQILTAEENKRKKDSWDGTSKNESWKKFNI